MRSFGSTWARVGAAALTTAAALVCTAPAAVAAVAADEYTVYNTGVARPGETSYVLTKCPSTYPYLVNLSAEMQGVPEAINGSRLLDVQPADYPAASKVTFSNMTPWSNPLKYFYVSLYATCSKTPPTSPTTTLSVTRAVKVPAKGMAQATVFCPTSMPGAVSGVVQWPAGVSAEYSVFRDSTPNSLTAEWQNSTDTTQNVKARLDCS